MLLAAASSLLMIPFDRVIFRDLQKEKRFGTSSSFGLVLQEQNL